MARLLVIDDSPLVLAFMTAVFNVPGAIGQVTGAGRGGTAISPTRSRMALPNAPHVVPRLSLFPDGVGRTGSRPASG